MRLDMRLPLQVLSVLALKCVQTEATATATATDFDLQTLGAGGELFLRPGAALPPLVHDAPLPPPEAIGLLPAGVTVKRAIVSRGPIQALPRSGSKFLPVPADAIAASKQGVHAHLVQAMATRPSMCDKAGTAETCGQFSKLMDILAEETNGIGEQLALSRVQQIMELKAWLHGAGGPAQRFAVLDSNKDGAISRNEAHAQGMNFDAFKIQDFNGDDAVSKQEVFHFLSAAVLVRELVPEVDDGNSSATTTECLDLVREVLSGQLVAPPRRHLFRLICIIAICSAIVVGALMVLARGRSLPEFVRRVWQK